MDAIERMQDSIAAKRGEHRILDEQIKKLERQPSCDSLQIRKLKKDKLSLLEEIEALERALKIALSEESKQLTATVHRLRIPESPELASVAVTKKVAAG